MLAVRQGFEPWVPISRYDGLANRCLKPLGHLTTLERGRRFELLSSAWKADAQPICQPRVSIITYTNLILDRCQVN